MPLRQIEFGTPEFQKMKDLRYRLLRKPLGLEFTNQEIARARNDLSIGYFEDEDLLGCCMISSKGNGIAKLRQMAVSDKLQGKGIGRTMVAFAENIARDHGFKKIIVHARQSAVGFYEKMGYQITKGPFIEITIPHYEMEKTIAN